VKAIGCQLSAIGQKTPSPPQTDTLMAESREPTAQTAVIAFFAGLVIARFHFELRT